MRTMFSFAVVAFLAGAQLLNAGTFKVDGKKSEVKWHGEKVTGKHWGTVAIATGSLEADGANIKGGTFEMDMNSIVCLDLEDKSTNGKLVGHLKSDDFFSVEKHPKAKLVIKKATKKSGNEYQMEGDLTIKGITKPISFPATVTMNGKSMTANANIVVDRTKYDIKYNSGNFFQNLGDKVIYDDFKLDVKLVANE